MSYDPKCEDLARLFLGDWPNIDVEKHAPILAQEIQNAIESYISLGEPEEPAEPEEDFTKWLAAAKSEIEFRHGVPARRVKRDQWKEQFALGRTPNEAAKAVASFVSAA